MKQKLIEYGGIESIDIAQVDQGGSSKEFEMTNDEGLVFAEFSIFQASGREYLSITEDTFNPVQ